MKISLICSQRNKKALLGSLAATGRLLSKARAELCSCHASQLAYVIDDNCRVQHCQCERNGSSHEPTFETSLIAQLSAPSL